MGAPVRAITWFAASRGIGLQEVEVFQVMLANE